MNTKGVLNEYESVRIADEYNEMAEKAFNDVIWSLIDIRNEMIFNIKPKLEVAKYFTKDRSRELFNHIDDNMVHREIKWHRQYASMLDDIYAKLYEYYDAMPRTGIDMSWLEDKIDRMYNAYMEGD